MTGLDSGEAQSQISTLVARGFASLKTLIIALDGSPPEAHRPSGTRSLEYRLRDASSIRNHVVSLLQDLCKSIDEGVSAVEGDTTPAEEQDDPTDLELEEYFQDDGSQGESEVSQILADIAHTVDCLLRLSITIRNPAPHDRFRSRVEEDIVEHFEKWDTKHVQDKFPLDVKIAQRLGRAAARRRQYFKYREEHFARLAEGLEADDQISRRDKGSTREKATTIASSIPNHLKDSFSEFADLADDNKSEVSGTSYALSSADSTRLRVPPIPKVHVDGPFKCPFCCMVVSIDTRREWKKHVFTDLQPYVCLANACRTPERQYSRRSDWIGHMRQDHWRFWSCPFGCQEIFSTTQEFEQHIEKSHSSQTAAQNLDTLQELSGRPDPKQAQGQCPICLESQITSDRHYSSHVAEHLESLALFTLPDPGIEEEDDNGSEGSNTEENQENTNNTHDEVCRSGGGSGCGRGRTGRENALCRNCHHERCQDCSTHYVARK